MPSAHAATVPSKSAGGERAVRAWRLRWLLSLFALALIAPLLGFGIFATNQMIVAERAAEQEQLRRTVGMLSAEVDRWLRGRIEILQALTESDSLKDGDFAGFHREASAVMRGTGHAILVVDRDFSQLVNTRVAYGTPLPQVGDRDTAGEVFATGKAAVGDIVVGQITGQPRVTVMVPVVIDGGVRYVAILSLDPAALGRIVDPEFLPEAWFAKVFDGKGLILARSDRHGKFFGDPIAADMQAKSSGRSAVTTIQDREGNAISYAFLRSDFSGWGTAVWVPLAVLEAPARQLWLTLAAVAVVAFGLSLLAAASLGRWLARPIARVANVAVKLGRGAPVRYKPSAIAEVNVVGATLAAAAEQRLQAEVALAQLAAMVESSDDAIIGVTLEGRITNWNSGAERIYGYAASEMIGQPIRRIIPPELRAEEEQILSRLKRGERIEHYETTRVAKDGRRIDVSLTVSLVRDRAGKVVGASKVARDITQRRRTEEHMRFLMRELSHRAKNVMAVVQAISWQTARKSVDLEDFEQRFMERLNALARSQDLLVKRDWKGVALDDLVRAQLEPFVDSAQERLAIEGPSLVLSPNAAQDLGLALHELATNASKYGALSVPAGRIEVNWTINNGTAREQRFRMTWRETGGPVVSPPVREGFGSTVITRSLSRTFNGKAEVEYRPEGLFWSFAAPVGDFLAELS